ncbi:anchor protein [Opitutaceae bacterium TAV5]|nr:anchor protein [Opitutaceae bacterium TAV5]
MKFSINPMKTKSTSIIAGSRILLRSLLALGAGLVTGLDAQAFASRTWIGQNNASWPEDANWTGSNGGGSGSVGVPNADSGFVSIVNGTTAVLDGNGSPGVAPLLMMGISTPYVPESGTPGEEGYKAGSAGAAGTGGLTITDNQLSANAIFVGGDAGALLGLLVPGESPVASQPEFESTGTLTLDNAGVSFDTAFVVGAGQDGHVTLGGGSVIQDGRNVQPGATNPADTPGMVVFGKEAMRVASLVLGGETGIPDHDFAGHPGSSTLTVKAGNGGTSWLGLDNSLNAIIAPAIVFSGNSTIDIEAGATLCLTSFADGGESSPTSGVTQFFDGATLRFDGAGADFSTRFISIGDLTVSFTDSLWDEGLQDYVEVTVTMTLGVGDVLDLTHVTAEGKLNVELTGFAIGSYELIHATGIVYGADYDASNLGTLFNLTGNSAEGARIYVQDNSLWVQVANTAVPEPATYAAIAGLTLLACAVVRRGDRG